MKRLISVLLTIILLIASVIPVLGNDPALRRGDVIKFGEYPQTEITTEALLNRLNTLPKEWTVYEPLTIEMDMMVEHYDGVATTKFSDLTLDGIRYRALMLTEQEDQIRYFRFDPIEWIVLDQEKGLLISRSVLDGQYFNHFWLNDPTDNDSAVYADANKTKLFHDYAQSDIRAWLNGAFYNTAFSAEDAAKLVKTKLDNAGYSVNPVTSEIGETWSLYKMLNANTAQEKNIYKIPAFSAQHSAYSETEDAVFLLSTDEYFSYNCATDEAIRFPTVSTYAQAAGVYIWDVSVPQEDGLVKVVEGQCSRCLRSPGDNAITVCYVHASDGISTHFAYASGCIANQNFGIRPVIKIDFNKKNPISGDVNNDGKVTAADARLALRRAVGLETYAEGSAQFLACDVDGNGKVTAADARKILRAAVGLEKLS